MSSPTDGKEPGLGTKQEFEPAAAPGADEATAEGQEPAPDEFGASIEQAKADLEQKLADLGTALEPLIDELETLETDRNETAQKLDGLKTEQNHVVEFLTQLTAALETLKKLKAQLFDRKEKGLYSTIDEQIATEQHRLDMLKSLLGSEKEGIGLMGKYKEKSAEYQKLQQDAIDFWRDEQEKPADERNGDEYSRLQREAEPLFGELQRLGDKIKIAKGGLKDSEKMLGDLNMLKTMGDSDREQFFDLAMQQTGESIQRQEEKKAQGDADILKIEGTVGELTGKIQDYERQREEMIAERKRTEELLSVVEDIEILYEEAKKDVADSGHLNAQLGGLYRTIKQAKAELRSVIKFVRDRLDSFRDDALESLDLSLGNKVAMEYELDDRSGQIMEALQRLITGFQTAFSTETPDENEHRMFIEDFRKLMLALQKTLGPRITDRERVRILQSTVTAQIERDKKTAAGFDAQELAVTNRDLAQENDDLRLELQGRVQELTTAQNQLAEARLELENMRASINKPLPPNAFDGIEKGQAETAEMATNGLGLGEPAELPTPDADEAEPRTAPVTEVED